MGTLSASTVILLHYSDNHHTGDLRRRAETVEEQVLDVKARLAVHEGVEKFIGDHESFRWSAWIL